ncbi:MAG: hypothetical protein K2M31_00310 [Muribaculaceae bacterium]|nr:hypothetical protein [Muribaculaceae bacterium]
MLNNPTILHVMKYPKLFLATNARKLLMMLGITYILTTLLLIFNLYATERYFYEQQNPGPDPINATRDLLWSSECDIMTFIAFVVIIISGSMMFGALSDRRSRLNTLEVPASHTVKFFTWFAVYLPVAIIAMWISFYAAQITRVCWTQLFTDFGSYAHIIPFHRVMLLEGGFVLEPSDIYDAMTTYGAMIFINSVFALGSVIFPRLSFLKTAISCSIISTMIGVAALLGHLVFFGLHANTDPRFAIFDTFPQREYIITAVMLFGALCCYLLSYYRFKQTEIINRW